jgi:CubicO group peptidase (beta-lactamase class C family)
MCCIDRLSPQPISEHPENKKTAPISYSLSPGAGSAAIRELSHRGLLGTRAAALRAKIPLMQGPQRLPTAASGARKRQLIVVGMPEKVVFASWAPPILAQPGEAVIYSSNPRQSGAGPVSSTWSNGAAMKLKLLLLASLLTLLSACTAHYELTLGDDDFNPSRLARVDQVVDQAIANGEIPGAVVLVSRGGNIDLLKAYGYADLASGKVMQTDAIFRIASMTKAITSVAIMILNERGYFSLNDPVSKYIPAFSQMKVITKIDDDGKIVAVDDAKNPIRIIDLLSHSSGISYPFIQNALQAPYVEAGIIDGVTGKNMKLESQMMLLARQPLMFEPGEKFQYGLSTDLLGYLIEVVSGQTLPEFIAANITEPLNMNDTWFYLPPDIAGRLVTLYAHVDGKGLVVSDGTESSIKLDNPNYPIEGARAYHCGGAGLSSTAEDYGRFLQMLLSDGELDGVRILSRKSVELMSAPRIDWDEDGVADFGLGFGVVSDLGKTDQLGSVGNLSWGGAFYTSFWIDPEEDLVAVFMSQVRPAESDVAAKFQTAVYQALQ